MSRKWATILLIFLHIVVCQSAASASQITIWTSGTLPDRYMNVIKSDPQMAGIEVSFLKATVEELQKLMLQGRGPDIFLISSGELGYMFGEENLLSLEDITRRSASLSNSMKFLIPATKNLVYLNGNQFGVPQAMRIQGICYNPAPVKDAGIWLTPNWTWDDFQQVAAKLSQLKKSIPTTYYHQLKYGLEWSINTTIGVAISSKPLSWVPFLWSNRGNLEKIDSPQSRETLSFLAELGLTGLVEPLFADQIYELALGKVYIAPGYSDDIYTVPYIGTKKQRINYPYATNELKLLPYPYSHTGNTSGLIHRIQAFVVSTFTKKIDEVSRFLAASLSKQAQQAAVQQGWISVRSDVQLPVELQTAKPLIDSLSTQANYSTDFNYINDQAELGFYQLLHGEVSLDEFIKLVKQAY